MPPLGHDLRIVVAAGQIVGAVRRLTAPGEWRTNVALGAKRLPADPPPAARELALTAAAAAEMDLVGIDLMPTGDGGWVVIEMNGAVEFTDAYSLDRNVFCGRSRGARRRGLRERAPSRWPRSGNNLSVTASSPRRRPSADAGHRDWRAAHRS